MMTRIVLLSLLWPGDDAGHPGKQDALSPTDVLVELFDAAEAGEELGRPLVAKGLGGVPVLERVAARVKSEKGKARVERVYGLIRERVRKDALENPETLRGIANKLPPSSLWPLGLDVADSAAPALFFDVKPYSDAGRLEILEYLVCPDPPGDKSYEAWASMRTEDWASFLKALGKGAGMPRLRWRDERGRTSESTLDKLLPWSEPRLNRNGLALGANHDESGHPVLAGRLGAVQIGVPLLPPK